MLPDNKNKVSITEYIYLKFTPQSKFYKKILSFIQFSKDKFLQLAQKILSNRLFSYLKKKKKKKNQEQRDKLLLHEIDNLFNVVYSILHYKKFHSQDIFVQAKHISEMRNFNQNETIAASCIIQRIGFKTVHLCFKSK